MTRLFDDVAADGGKDAAWFRHEEHKRAAVLVRERADRVSDGKLKQSALAAVMSWDTAVACAPPATDPVLMIGDGPDGQDNRQKTVQRDRRLSRVAGVAEEGISHCEAALSRLNALSRFPP
jgi:hypothetical protein